MGKVKNLLFVVVSLIITDSIEEMNILIPNYRFILVQIVIEILLWL